MLRNVPRGPFIYTWRGWGNYRPVRKDTGIFSTLIAVHFYSSNMHNHSHADMHYDPLSLGAPLQSFQHRNASQDLGIWGNSYLDQPPYLYLASNTSLALGDLQQHTSLPQSSLSPYAQSQQHIGNPASHANISSGRHERLSRTSENPDRYPVSPPEAPLPSHQSRQTLNTAGDEGVADGRNLVIESIDPT